ncbi:hypothetical protein SAMN02799624_04309 [Paenibacillus sp. UNC496MF]|uniref:DUF3995 domain-containing protein n=1 Tax=Paenibacillus sp. UNC496MF TaxID=1502753 RepID=UPI0008E6919A|nr:DUF3995 domain-containing protein [Paenibacillus sp. UNC496MF]SFJ39928.1 hypothetical protein SAMN02799624_04309 [Paenibacillus sp. UNC496MF]
MSKIDFKVCPGYIGCFWAVIYAVFVRFYQAAGGPVGLPGRLAELEGFQMASYFAGVVVLLAGFYLLGLVKPWGRTVPSWLPLIGGKNVHPLLLLVPALIGCAFSIAHGVSGVITKILYLAGIITIQIPGWIELDVRGLILWDLLFYEPWFIVMGILAGMAAWNYAKDTKILQPFLRRSANLYLCLIVLLTALFVSAIIFDFLKY